MNEICDSCGHDRSKHLGALGCLEGWEGDDPGCMCFKDFTKPSPNHE